jgi:ribosomal-protein-alanine N-acetyltransferase
MKKLFPEIPVLNNGQIELRALTQADAEALEEMVNSRRVYRYLPTFLFEKKYPDVREVIRRLYTECLEESLILGVFSGDGSSFDTFCGLAEMYGYKEKIHKISFGCRLAEHALGKGIGTQASGMMADLLRREKGIGIITASSMIENRASARALEKNGFTLVVHAAEEDWGFGTPTLADKWIL